MLASKSSILPCMLQEINLMEKLSFDRNIVQFYGAVLSAPAPMLVLEYMEGKLCFNIIMKPFQSPTTICTVADCVVFQEHCSAESDAFLSKSLQGFVRRIAPLLQKACPLVSHFL